jgi:hypothetical protein
MAQSIKDITKAVATVAVKESMAMVRIVVAVIAAPTQKKVSVTCPTPALGL